MSTEKLAGLYQEAKRNREAINAQREQLDDMQQRQIDLETAIMNELAAITGDDSQPFGGGSSAVIRRLF